MALNVFENNQDGKQVQQSNQGGVENESGNGRR